MEHVAEIVRDRRLENKDEGAYIEAVQALSVERRTGPSGHVSAPTLRSSYELAKPRCPLSHMKVSLKRYSDQTATVAQ